MGEKIYIGISGKMGSGKTTLSDGILGSLKQSAGTRVSLSEPIKKIQDNIYRDLGIEIEGDKDRDLLIALGKWGRNKESNFWLKEAIINMKLKSEEVIICDDIRFENEADWFSNNGILLRIEGEQRGDNVDHNVNDITETSLDNYNFKYYINNTVEREEMIMQGLYAIAQHLGVTEELVASMAQEVTDGR